MKIKSWCGCSMAGVHFPVRVIPHQVAQKTLCFDLLINFCILVGNLKELIVIGLDSCR